MKETFFRSPYRWIPRTALPKVFEIVKTLVWTFPKNILKYRAWLANDADWDWEYLAEVMEMKLRQMAAYSTKYGICERSGENAAECLEAAECLSRMRKEDYQDKHGYDRYRSMTHEEQKAMWDAAHADEAADRERFGTLMKKIQWWWE